MLSIVNCSQKKVEESVTSFTKTDSLTEIYLNLQDSILTAWNLMINDDNKKILAMHALVHELQVTGKFDAEKLETLDERIQQLKRIRYTPKSLANTDVIDEYDFASNSLVAELISLAESHSAFAYNTTLQSLVETIRTAEQRIENYRTEYDAVVTHYNQFIMANRDHMKEIDNTGTVEKKPVFHMVSE
ncbi:MAG: LemA family protein [Cyclobacteriaceae bacterium]|nr:LemA family protein [Cyclobacteriaceae bacterium]